jgi:hypothetical protein
MNIPSSDTKHVHKIDNEKIEEVTSKISTENEYAVEEEVKPEPKKVMSELKVMPKTKLWVGYIDLNTGRKYQKTIEVDEELSLDPNGQWLFSLGHGHVNFSVNGEIDSYKDYRSMHFLYEYGELKKLSRPEYLALNKGKEW